MVCFLAAPHIQQDIEDKLLKALVNANIPWCFVEDEYFVEFIKLVRLNFNLKTRKTYSNTVMDRVCGIIQREEQLTPLRRMGAIVDGIYRGKMEEYRSNGMLTRPGGKTGYIYVLPKFVGLKKSEMTENQHYFSTFEEVKRIGGANICRLTIL